MTREEAINILEHTLDYWKHINDEEAFPIYDDIEALQMAVDALKADVPDTNVGKWVLCSERLPEYGDTVLTYTQDGDYHVNHIIDEESGEWFYDGVLTWMEIPKPYKENK